MDIKLALLCLIISAIITLSYLDDENIDRMKRQFRQWQWREFRLRQNKS
jgi:hypothetical protein